MMTMTRVISLFSWVFFCCLVSKKYWNKSFDFTLGWTMGVIKLRVGKLMTTLAIAATPHEFRKKWMFQSSCRPQILSRLQIASFPRNDFKPFSFPEPPVPLSRWGPVSTFARDPRVRRLPPAKSDRRLWKREWIRTEWLQTRNISQNPIRALKHFVSWASWAFSFALFTWRRQTHEKYLTLASWPLFKGRPALLLNWYPSLWKEYS